MSDSSTIDECQDALLSLSLSDSSRSGWIPRDSNVVHQPQTQIQTQAQAPMQEKLQASSADFDHFKYYFGTGPGTFAGGESYIDAAFRSSSEGKAYIFMRDEYVVLDYSQGITFATVQEGPLPICKRFSFLKHTSFVEYGLDAAFGCGENEAVIFSTHECARINYGSNPSYDLKLISDMFPSLQQTRFESGIDAALESQKPNETFIFKGDKCAIMHHSSLVRICTISEAFPFLKGTPFTSGIEAALASKITNSYEVLLFKERNWAFIDYGYGCHSEPSNPKVFWAPKVFHPFEDLLPRKNSGLDCHDINHCGCESDTESNDISGSSRRIYTQEEAQRVVDAWVLALRSGRHVTTEDIYREMQEEEEAKANKSIIEG